MRQVMDMGVPQITCIGVPEHFFIHIQSIPGLVHIESRAGEQLVLVNRNDGTLFIRAECTISTSDIAGLKMSPLSEFRIKPNRSVMVQFCDGLEIEITHRNIH